MLITNNEIVPITATNPTTVSSLPLYTLDNAGNYVLCTPDAFVKVGDYYVPAYSKQTVQIAEVPPAP